MKKRKDVKQYISSTSPSPKALINASLHHGSYSFLRTASCAQIPEYSFLRTGSCVKLPAYVQVPPC